MRKHSSKKKDRDPWTKCESCLCFIPRIKFVAHNKENCGVNQVTNDIVNDKIVRPTADGELGGSLDPGECLSDEVIKPMPSLRKTGYIKDTEFYALLSIYKQDGNF